jgi:glycerol uptake facilitator-like aquaporin
MGKKLLAEAFGTFWLVLGGCGSAAIAANFPYLTGADIAPGNPFGLGSFGVSLAFGLTVVTMVYAIGHISGCHLNPAVSFGLWASGRMKGSELLPYIVAQVIGAVLAGGFIKLVVAGGPALELVMGGSNPLATNGWGVHSPGDYGFWAALLVGGGAHLLLPAGDHRSHRPPGPRRFRRCGGGGSAVAVLGRSDRGSPDRGLGLSQRVQRAGLLIQLPWRLPR